MEDQREKESNLILKKSFTVFGVVLVLSGGLCTRNNHELSPSLHGQTRRTERGIVILSRFVHISYTAALGIAGAAGLLVLVGIFVIFAGTRKPTPVSTTLRP